MVTKRTHQMLSLPILLVILLIGSSQGQPDDWATFLARQDITCDQPMPNSWMNYFLIGNGHMGAQVYKDDRRRHNQAGDGRIKWYLGRTDVTDHRGQPTLGEKEVAWMRPRLPIGYFVWDVPGGPQGGSSRTHLWDAEVTGTFTTTSGTMEWRSFFATDPAVLLIEWKHTGGALESCFDFEADSSTSPASSFIPEDYESNPPAERMVIDDIQVSVQPMLAGGEYAVAWKVVDGPDGAKRLFASIGNSWEGAEGRTEAVDAVKAALAMPFDNLVANHRQWWHAYYPKSFVSMSDPKAESYYWRGIYVRASSTRGDKLPMDLQGPWYEPTGLGWPAVWWNRNLQECHYALAMANRTELGMSLVNMINRNKQNLALNAGSYSDDSYVVGHVSSWDCRCNADNESANLLRALYQYWEIYHYTMDDDLLRDHLFGLLKGAVNYYRHRILRKGGTPWTLAQTRCPEYTTVTNCNYDLGFLRWACEKLVWANERLGLGDPLATEWQAIQDSLIDYPTDDHGFMFGTGKTFSWIQGGGEYRRRYSHFVAFYPLQLVNWSNPDDRDAITRTIDWYTVRGFAGLNQSSTAAVAGWYARIGQPDEGYRYLERFIDSITYLNSLSKERSPLSGAQGIALQSIHDLLLQYRNETIHVLTSVPSGWSDVSFRDLRTPGAFLVDAERTDGVVQFVRITSEAGEPCMVRTGLPEPIAIEGAGAELEAVGDSTYRIVGLDAGETVLLYNQENPVGAIAGLGSRVSGHSLDKVRVFRNAAGKLCVDIRGDDAVRVSLFGLNGARIASKQFTGAGTWQPQTRSADAVYVVRLESAGHAVTRVQPSYR